MAVAGVLLFWASWLRLVGELQQNGMFPRRTKAAVGDSQQNLQLIKSAPPLLQVDSRAGVVSFELACGALAVTWEVQLGYYHARLRSRLDPQLHPKTITCLSI